MHGKPSALWSLLSGHTGLLFPIVPKETRADEKKLCRHTLYAGACGDATRAFLPGTDLPSQNRSIIFPPGSGRSPKENPLENP